MLLRPIFPLQLSQRIAALSAKTPAGAKRRILVVEDNEVNQRVAQLLLERLGYEVTRAMNGHTAVTLAGANSYSAILMDCQMPEFDGFATTRAIRAQEAGRRTPIIAMTANIMKGSREACLDAGMDDFLPKPVQLNELRQTLDQWVQRATKSPAIERKVLEELKHLSPSGDDFVTEIIELFLNDSQQRLLNLQSAISRAEHNKAQREAHTIKGSAANVGANKLSASASALEACLKQGKADEIERHLLALELEASHAIEELTAFSSSLKRDEDKHG